MNGRCPPDPDPTYIVLTPRPEFAGEIAAEELGGCFNVEYYRRLCHASLCPSLEQLFISTVVKKEGKSCG
jgi:hypothetical protein